MENLSRRTMLKQVARMSAAAAASTFLPSIIGCCDRAEERITLNVVLHGLFVLNFTNVEIEMFTPFVEDHIYRAGNWDWNTLEHLRPGKAYRLRGVENVLSQPDLPTKNNILLPQDKFTHRVHPERSIFVVYLPFPETIRLLRIVNDGENNQDPDHNTIAINSLSLCQVLTYSVPDYRSLGLAGTGWRPSVDPSTRTVNLHFWAEPLLRMPRQHACVAYQRLSQLLEPLTLTLGTDKTAPLDPDTNVYGLPREQEQGLSEWESGGEGSYPTNCSVTMVKNQG